MVKQAARSREHERQSNDLPIAEYEEGFLSNGKSMNRSWVYNL